MTIRVHPRSSVAVFLCALSGLCVKLFAADVSPVLTWDVEISRLAQYKIELRRGETVILQPHFTEYSSDKDLTGASSVILRYRTAAMTSTYYSVTGSVYSATGGLARIRTDGIWPTNSSYSYEISVATATSVLCRAYGTLAIAGSIGYDSSETPTPETNYVTRSEWAAAEAAMQAALDDITGPPDITVLSNRVDAIELWPTSNWTAAFSWGDWTAAGLQRSNTLGSAAYSNSAAFATAAQGARADLALTNPAAFDAAGSATAVSNAIAAGAASGAAYTGTVSSVTVNGTNYPPDGAGLVDLGTIAGSGAGDNLGNGNGGGTVTVSNLAALYVGGVKFDGANSTGPTTESIVKLSTDGGRLAYLFPWYATNGQALVWNVSRDQWEPGTVSIAESDPVWAASDLAANNGAGLTNIQGASVSGNVTGALYAVTAGTAGSATTAAGGWPTTWPASTITNLPSPGCTTLTGTNLAISGATFAYNATSTNRTTISVSSTAPRYIYALEILGTNAIDLADGLQLRGTWTVTGTNAIVLVPYTGTVWNVYGRGL